jgi:hypothetical protein
VTKSLVHLNFSGCGFIGELPDVLGTCTIFEYLDLSHNQLYRGPFCLIVWTEDNERNDG